MPESNSGLSNPFTKWILALAVGIPTVGYVYYYFRKNSSPQNIPTKSNDLKENDEEILEKKKTSTEKVKEEGPLERALALKNAGNDFYKQRLHKDAIRCYTEAIELCPKEEKEYLATFYQNRAAAHEVLNNVEDVIKDCNEAIKLKNNYTKALMRRYKNLEKVGNLRQALEDVTACCLLEQFGNSDTLTAADRILKALGLNAAKIALREERYEDILDHCNEEISDPLHDRNSPTEPLLQALLLRATMYSLTSQTKLALEDLNCIIDSKPDNMKLLVNAHLKRACVLMHLEDPDKALEDFDTASKLDSNNSDAAHQKAQILLMSEKLPEALVEFERAVTLSPKFPLSLVQKIYAEYRKAVVDRDFTKMNSSKSALKKAVAKYPSCSEGYMLLAQVYADSHEYEEAESIFIQGTKADPLNASLLVHLGMLYLQWRGDLENAVKSIEKGIEVDPKCEFAYETLASVEAQRGNMLKSITLFDKALAFSKSEKEAAHILSLKAAAQAQHSVAASLGINFTK